jgi:hypothetical protein
MPPRRERPDEIGYGSLQGLKTRWKKRSEEVPGDEPEEIQDAKSFNPFSVY